MDQQDQANSGNESSAASVQIPPWAYWAVPVLLAFVLRIVSLELNSMSHDELSTWARTEYNRARGVITYGVKPDYHPPGHFLLIFAIKKLGWETAFALRLPSVIAGALSVGVLYRIGRQLFDRWTGCMAALLLAVNWAAIYYAQDARAYALLILLTLLCVDASIRLVRAMRASEASRTVDWIQLVLAGATAAYVHYYGLFFVGLLGLGCILVMYKKKRSAIQLAIGFASILLLYAPWIPTLIEDLQHTTIWIPRHGIDFFPRWWMWTFGNALIPAILAAGLTLVGLVMVVLKKKYKVRNAAWFTTAIVLAWLLAPGMVAFLKSLVSTPALTNRNILPSAPAAFLLVALAVRHFPVKQTLRPFVFAGFLGVMLWDLVVVKGYYTEPTKEEYRDVVKAVLDQSPDTLFGRCGIKHHFQYYIEQYGASVEIDKNLCRPPQIETFAERNPGKSLTFVRVHYKPENEVMDYLDEHYLTTQVFKARDAVGMILEPRPKPTPPKKEVAQTVTTAPDEDAAQAGGGAPPDGTASDGASSAGTAPDGTNPAGDASTDASVQTKPTTQKEAGVVSACNNEMPKLNRTKAWSLWPNKAGLLMDSMANGIRLRRDTDDGERVNMCMRGRIPAGGTLEYTGNWKVRFGASGGAAQISARYFGADGKWVSGADDQRPVWMVKTAKEDMELTPFTKTFVAPKAAKTVQLCLVLVGSEGMIEMRDACVQTAP